MGWAWFNAITAAFNAGWYAQYGNGLNAGTAVIGALCAILLALDAR